MNHTTVKLTIEGIGEGIVPKSSPASAQDCFSGAVPPPPKAHDTMPDSCSGCDKRVEGTCPNWTEAGLPKIEQ